MDEEDEDSSGDGLDGVRMRITGCPIFTPKNGQCHKVKYFLRRISEFHKLFGGSFRLDGF